MIEDELTGEGTHEFVFRFHFAPGLEIEVRPDGIVEACDKMSDARLFIKCQKPERKRGQVEHSDTEVKPTAESQFSSRDYGEKAPSTSVCWTIRAATPFDLQFALIPVAIHEDESERLRLVSEARATKG